MERCPRRSIVHHFNPKYWRTWEWADVSQCGIRSALSILQRHTGQHLSLLGDHVRTYWQFAFIWIVMDIATVALLNHVKGSCFVHAPYLRSHSLKFTLFRHTGIHAWSRCQQKSRDKSKEDPLQSTKTQTSSKQPTHNTAQPPWRLLPLSSSQPPPQPPSRPAQSSPRQPNHRPSQWEASSKAEVPKSQSVKTRIMPCGWMMDLVDVPLLNLRSLILRSRWRRMSPRRVDLSSLGIIRWWHIEAMGGLVLLSID